MKLKVDADGKVVVQDGKPVFVQEDGKDFIADVPGMYSKITALTGEAAGHRKAKEAAEEKLKAFDGISDAEAARKALETVSNLDQGQLVTAGKVEEIKKAAAQAAKEQVEAAARASAEKIKELESAREKLTGDLYGEKVGGAFGRSKFITDKVAVPPDMLQAVFGQRFKVEEGKIVAYDAAGNKMYSRAKPGEVADFDEALELLVDSYPYRDTILKGTGNSGSGSQGGTAGAGGKTLTRAAYEAMDPAAKSAAMQSGTTLVD